MDANANGRTDWARLLADRYGLRPGEVMMGDKIVDARAAAMIARAAAAGVDVTTAIREVRSHAR